MPDRGTDPPPQAASEPDETQPVESNVETQPVETTGRWIGPTDRPLLSWLTTPAGRTGSVGVVIVAPFGYELWSSHRTLRTLAERLAGQGCSVVRFDLDGTGDSGGDQWDPDRLPTWRHDVGIAAASLRALGVSSLVLVGLRMGATLALLEGAATGADAVVAWAPIVQGRRYVRELQLLGVPVPETPSTAGRGGGIVQAGSVFSVDLLGALSVLDLSSLPSAPASRVLVVDRDDRPQSGLLLDRLAALGCQTDHLVRPGTDLAIDRPSEYATVPVDIVEQISRWVGTGHAVDRVAEPRREATIRWAMTSLSEEVVRLGPSGLVGIMTRAGEVERATVVWLNSGSEHHVGPGRAWVEYARDLALAGYSSVRVDFTGWGESPDSGHAPGRPYDQHGLEEVGEIAAALRAGGHRRVVVAGLCAGAWMALRAALVVELDGVVAINPQLYWRPGDPVEADIVGETRARRQPEIRRIKRLRRTGLWWALDALGVRHPAAAWLRRLSRTGTPVMCLFTEGDDGLEFLEDRTARAWAQARRQGTVDLVVVGEIDHPMHRHWYRSKVVSAIHDWLDTHTTGD